MRKGALRSPGCGGVSFAKAWFAKASARASRRALLLAGVAALACHAGAASAQPQGNIRNRAPAAPLPDDGLGPRDLLLQADSVAQDQPHSLVTASGHVEARYQGKTLRADKMVYNTTTGVAHAYGHAVVVSPDGSVIYGEDITLDDQFRAAVALGFATRQVGNTTLTAGSAVKRNETVNQLNNAVYTACNICALDGRPVAPTWSISASRIIEDRQRGVIYYRNAVIRVLGVPIFYAPVFWHPDPTTPRRSGLLAPKIEYSRRRGGSYEQPYLQTLGPSTDLIVSPQINTRVNPFLNLRLTERFYSGMVDVRAGYTDSRNFNNDVKFGDNTSRSYVLARGLFDVTPDKNWVWGFGAERVTDPTLFERYGIHNVYTDRGPFPADTDRLISQVYTVREDTNSYVSIAALDFQSLRAYGLKPNFVDGQPVIVGGVQTSGPEGAFESSKAFPIVGPLIEARFDPPDAFLGGQLRLQADAVALTRNDAVLSVFDPTGVIVQGPQLENNGAAYDTAAKLFAESKVSGQTVHQQISALSYTDSRRASLGGNWQSTFTLDDGIRIQPFVYGRGDFYSISDAQIYNPNTGNLDPGKSTVGQLSGTAGANLSWPFIKPIGAASIVLEPLAQVDVSPVYKVNPNIPNEDSASFEYDETNLFSVNRFSGFDLLEGGQRINVGGRSTVDWGTGQNASLLVGRTFRAQDDPQFTATSGLQNTSSDWIVAATASPIPGMSLFTRSRLNSSSFALEREEAGAAYGSARFSASVRYDLEHSGLQEIVSGANIGQSVTAPSQDISAGGFFFFTRNWGVSAVVSRDLQQDVFPIAQVGLIYDNECIRVDVLYTRDETYGNVIGNSDSISFRISLSTLGGTAPLAPANSRGSR